MPFVLQVVLHPAFSGEGVITTNSFSGGFNLSRRKLPKSRRFARISTSDQKVAGSSPAGCTNKINGSVNAPSRLKSQLCWGLCWGTSPRRVLCARIEPAPSTKAAILVAALARASSESCRQLGDNRRLFAQAMPFGLRGTCGLLKDHARFSDCRCKPLEVFWVKIAASVSGTALNTGRLPRMKSIKVLAASGSLAEVKINASRIPPFLIAVNKMSFLGRRNLERVLRERINAWMGCKVSGAGVGQQPINADRLISPNRVRHYLEWCVSVPWELILSRQPKNGRAISSIILTTTSGN
jgi:hypothetical protein